MKKAIYTTVRDENVFLPIWLKHYSKFFAPEDIYVYDHLTTDGSVELAKQQYKFNHIVLDYPLYSDFNWYTSTTKNTQKELLKKYDVVLYTEADEIVYHHSGLGNYIDAMTSDVASCNGYMICHDRFIEPALDVTKSILSQRKYWTKDGCSDKTILSKVPLAWGHGFHSCIDTPEQPKGEGEFILSNPDPELLLLHLHLIDFNCALAKHMKTRTYVTSKTALEKWHGWQGRIVGKNFETWFDLKWGEIPQLIPQELRIKDFI